VIAVLWEMTGFRQIACPVDKQYKGKTTYNLRRKFAHLLNAVTATSHKPLIYIAYLGIFMFVPAGIYILYVLSRYLFFGVGVNGWLSLILSLWFLGGMNIFVLGVVAMYLSVIFDETKQRPYTIIRQIYQRDPVLLSEENVRD